MASQNCWCGCQNFEDNWLLLFFIPHVYACAKGLGNRFVHLSVCHKCLGLLSHIEIKRIQMFWGKNRRKLKWQQLLGAEPRTPGLCSLCFMATGQPSTLAILYMYCGSTPNGILTADSEWLPGVWLRHFSPTCAVHIEGWWLSGYYNSVAEHWLHKPGVLGLIPGDCQPFFDFKHLKSHCQFVSLLNILTPFTGLNNCSMQQQSKGIKKSWKLNCCGVY